MCTVLFAYQSHPQYPLIILSNRDEFYERPTKNAHFWKHAPHVYGGIDLTAGGTWLATSMKHQIAFLTNFRDFSRHKTESVSRGFLPRDYMLSDLAAFDYLKEVQKHKDDYNPFNLILGDLDTLYYYSNIKDMIIPVAAGVHGLSNGLLDESWPKVDYGITALESLLQQTDLNLDALFDILDQRQTYDIDVLPHTGIEESLEKSLSSVFIALDNYGTRYQTIVLFHSDGSISYHEKSRNADDKWTLKSQKI